MRPILSFFTFLFVSQSVFALRATFDYFVFHDPITGPYIECLVNFDGATFKMAAMDSGRFQARAELTIIFSKLDQVVNFRKVVVDGPLVLKREENEFLSLERFSIPNGTYSMELIMRDLNSNLDDQATIRKIITINNPSTDLFISDIEFISAYRKSAETNAFSKSGMDMMPFNSAFFTSDINTLTFYSEIYNSDKTFGEGKAFVSTLCVIDKEENSFEECRKMKREKTASVVPLFQAIDISNLPSGEYKLRIELRDAQNKMVIIKERNFTRSLVRNINHANFELPVELLNSTFVSRFTHRDSLLEIVQSHLPIANNIERISIDNQLSTADLDMLQSFLYTFWYNKDSVNPEAAFLEYQAKVKKVHEIFGTRIKKGWRTERGRVYLQYGAPNTRVVRNHDVDYWPFEIWHYYETNNQLHDRRFLFYDTSLSGDMELLHSDVPSETKNHNWKEMVRSRITASHSSTSSSNNANQMSDSHGGDELEDLWNTPH